MNCFYRIIWSHARQAVVVVGELAKRAGKVRRRRRPALAVAGTALLLGAGAVQAEVAAGALPRGGAIVTGQGAISQLGNQLQVLQQSGRLIANWESFSIGNGARVEFVQPGSDSVALNRVLGADPSALLGQLQANGRVYLVNPNGVVVGPDARIDTAAFLASALDVSDTDFLADGDLLLAGESRQPVVNLGRINASNGDVILVAYQVSNAGHIEAPNGVAALGASSAVVYSPEGDQTLLIKAELDAAQAPGAVGIDNSGVIAAAQAELKAAGGNLYELAINQSGVVRATGSATRNGRVLLTAEGGNLVHSGSIAAHNADGSGGEVLIGGGFRGADPSVANAARTRVGAEALIDVSAEGEQGDAGRAIVWADAATQFAGSVLGRGGRLGGDGGFVEISGKQALDFQGTVDLRAPAGSAGTLLLDPASLTVQAGGTDSNLAPSGSDPLSYWPDGNAVSTLTVATLEAQLALSSVVLDTSYVYAEANSAADGSIVVEDAVSWSSGNTLTFNAGNSIVVNADLDAGTGDIVFALGNFNDGGNSGGRYVAGDLIVAATATVSADTVTISENTSAYVEGRVVSGWGAVGGVDFAGTLIANTLDLETRVGLWDDYGGFSGDVIIDNPANQIRNLTSSLVEGSFTLNVVVEDGTHPADRDGTQDPGLFQKSLSIVNGGASGMRVDGGFYLLSELMFNASELSLVSAGDLVLGAGTDIRMVGGGKVDATLASQDGSFINQADLGATVLANATTGRTLIYSDDPANTVTGGIDYAPLYNKRYATDPPAGIAVSGNRLVYSLAPMLTFTANPARRTYGAANPAFSYTVSGLVGGDSAAAAFSGVPTLASAIDATTPAGLYADAITLTQGSVVLSDYGYQFAAVAGDLTIDKAVLTVTPDAASRLYGDADPVFTGSISGFVNGETAAVLTAPPVYTSSALLDSPVGSYDILASGDGNPNYTYSSSAGNGLLSIIPAPLTVTADAASRLYGAANPNFSASFSGLKAGDTAADFPALVFSTPDSALDSDVGGGYLIRPGGLVNANYSYTYVDGALSITPAPLTVTADNAAHVFDNSVPDPAGYTATISGLVAGDQAADYSAQLVFANTADGSATGQYPITVSGIVDANYAVTYLPGTLTIGNQVLSVTADSFTRLYGEANPAFTSTIAGFVGDDTEAVLLSPVTYITAAVLDSPVGTYSIIPGGATAANYDFSFVNGTLTIDPALLTIRADSASRTYGAADPLFSATFIGLVAGDTADDIAGLTLGSDALVGSPVGNGYIITPANAGNANYSISYETGVLSITPAPLTVAANAKTRLYGAADPLFDAQFTGLVAGDTSAVLGGLAFTTDATTTSGVGSGYRITPGGAINANYTIAYVDAPLTITPAPLNIAADNASRIFGDANPAFSAQVSGLVAGDVEADLGSVTLLTSADAQSDVGAYAITPGGAVNANYSITYVPGTLTIEPRALTITANSQSAVFGDALAAYTLGFDNLAAFHTAADLGNPRAAGVIGSTNDVGSYPIQVIGGANANYDITRVNGELTVTPRPVTVTASDMSREYGDANPAFLVSVSNQAAAAPLGTSGLSFVTLADAASDVGSYSITPSGIVNPNYAITYAGGTLSVTPAPLSYAAVSRSREYGLANPTLSLTDASGYKLGHDMVDVLSNVVLSTSATQESSVGSYPIELTADVINSNYAVTFDPATLTVTKAPLYLVPALSSRLYGDPDPAFSLSATGLRNGDTTAVVTGAFFMSGAPANAGVGSYPVSLLNAYATNYSLSYGSGTINVLPRPLTISADDVSREYGEANPAFTASFSGLASFDTAAAIPGVSVSTTATAASNVLDGGYGLNVTSGNNPNYSISYQSGRLHITPAPLLIAIDDVSRQYATANPELTGSVVSGLKLGDTVGDLLLSYSTPATPTSSVGNYPIEVYLASPNYFPVGGLGTLSVTPAPLSLLIEPGFNLNRSYGDSSIDFSAALNVAGLQFGAQPGDVVSVVDPTDAATPVGSYVLQASVLDPNYRIGTFAGNGFVIQQRRITLTFADATRLYGDANPDLLGLLDTSDLFAPGDGPGNVLSAITTTAAQNSPVGEYPIAVSSINSNYGIDAVNGSLSVTPRPLRVNLGQFERVFGEPDPASLDHLRAADEPYDLMPFDALASVLDITLPPQEAGVGSYSLSAELISGNYNLIDFAGQLMVTPRPIVVRVPDEYTRTYGDANPPVGLSVLGDPSVPGIGLASFHTLEDLVYLGLPDEHFPAGNYLAMPEVNAAVAANYDLTLTRPEGFIVQITPRPIGIAFHDFTRRYGEENGELGSLFHTVLLDGVGSSQGLTAFDSFDELFSISLPGVTAGAGTHNLATLLDNRSYAVTLTNGNGSMTIEPRPIGLYIYDRSRRYGDDNSGLRRLYDPIITVDEGPQGLASFDSYDDVIAINLPDATAEGGVYQAVTLLDNPNYAPHVSHQGSFTITPRNLVIGGSTVYRDYGDTGFTFISVGGDGLAAFDTIESVLSLDLPTPLSESSTAGYYPLAGYALNNSNNYRVSSFAPEVFTILPRQVGLTVDDQNLSFDDAGALNSYLADPDRVFSTTVSNLANGDTIDDAFPIIRYQVVDTDAVPALATLPTPDNIVIPTRAMLEQDSSLIGHGVQLDPAVAPYNTPNPAVVRTAADVQSADGITLSRFATVYDGFDTEPNYVLTQVNNGQVTLKVPKTTVYLAGQAINISGFTLSDTYGDLQRQAEREPLVVSSKAHPPGLKSLFDTGNAQLANDMIIGYLQSLMTAGETYNFPEGGLLAEITRASEGTLADVTPFRIQRWLERNADNPQVLSMLAEPLAHYARGFVEKDPATYTPQETAFARLLSRHMENARDAVVQKSREKHDEWVATQAKRPTSTATFGMDPPWGDFVSDAAGEYVAEDIEQRIAVTAGAAGGAGVATGMAIATLTSFIMPYAFGKAAAVGLSTSILAGSAGAAGAGMGVGTAVAVVALPATMVAAAVAGSVVRVYQMVDNAKQKQTYDTIVAGYGQSIVPSQFSLTEPDGTENVLNGTIMVGALASLLYP